ncbi:MAG: H-NS histone family protein [Pseudomonadota bacterium]
MKIDLKGASRKELEKLKKDVEKALAKVNQKELKAARDEAAKVMAKHGFSLADIEGAPKRAPRGTAKPKTKAAPKYANPADASQTWTGKGRQPVWYKEGIAAGKTPASMEIKKG